MNIYGVTIQYIEHDTGGFIQNKAGIDVQEFQDMMSLENPFLLIKSKFEI